MKRTIIILFVFLTVGCVSTQDEPSILLEDIPGCPDIIELTSKNLIEIGIEQTVIQRWKDYILNSTLICGDASNPCISAY